MIMKAVQSKMYSVGRQAGHSGQWMVQMKFKDSLLKNSLLLVFLFHSGLQVIE